MSFDEAFKRLEMMCSTCPKAGCCTRCISDKLRNSIVKFRKEEPTVSDLIEDLIMQVEKAESM